LYRLRISNSLFHSRLLDLLLDVNSSAQIPADKRIDLSTETPSLSEVPALVTSAELARLDLSTSEGQAIYNEIRAILDEKAAEKAASKSPKSLASLLSTTPHLNAQSPLVPADILSSFAPLHGHTEPIAYLTPDAIDDYIYDIDASLGMVSPRPTRGPTQTDLALKNPHSVYNWLRQHEPKIFLQDGESSEKSSGKPGSLRGAGKRASMPAPSTPNALEIVEEDGLGYDPTISGLEPTKTAKGKRKRDDDGGYHPKSGAAADGKRKPRPKKQKIEGETPAPSSRKKASPKDRKPKEKASSPTAVDPETPSEAVEAVEAV
jgi:hypothetical protein